MISAAAQAANILESTKKPKNLASRAAKKGVVEKGRTYKATRLAVDLESEDPKLKNFTISNFKKTASEHQLKFMLQEIVSMVLAQFEKMELTLRDQAAMVAFAIKSFQRGHIFANVDHAVFYEEDNVVSFEIFSLAGN